MNDRLRMLAGGRGKTVKVAVRVVPLPPEAGFARPGSRNLSSAALTASPPGAAIRGEHGVDLERSRGAGAAHDAASPFTYIQHVPTKWEEHK